MTVKAMIRPLDFTDYEGKNYGDPYVPEHTQGALRRYVEEGYNPGGFLSAVLCNDLMGAVARADSENIRALKDICMFVHNRLPSDCWGSAANMAAWTEYIWKMKSGE